jgi:hypothetical protein
VVTSGTSGGRCSSTRPRRAKIKEPQPRPLCQDGKRG